MYRGPSASLRMTGLVGVDREQATAKAKAFLVEKVQAVLVGRRYRGPSTAQLASAQAAPLRMTGLVVWSAWFSWIWWVGFWLGGLGGLC